MSVFEDDFESGLITEDEGGKWTLASVSEGALLTLSSESFEGLYALHAEVPRTTTGWADAHLEKRFDAAYNQIVGEVEVKIKSISGVYVRGFLLLFGYGRILASLGVNGDRSLRLMYWDNGNFKTVISSTTLDLDRYQNVKLEAVVDADGTGDGSLRVIVDGVAVPDLTLIGLIQDDFCSVNRIGVGAHSAWDVNAVILIDSVKAYTTIIPPPPTHTLSINSNPIGISFTIKEVGMSLVTPWSGVLEEGTYEVEMPSNVIVGADTYNFLQWEDATTNPIRTVNLASDFSIEASYQLQIITALEVHAFLNSNEVNADGLIVETGFTFQTGLNGIIIDVAPGTYTIRLTYLGVTKDYIRTVMEEETIRVDGQMTPPKPSMLLPLLGLGAVALILLKGKKK